MDPKTVALLARLRERAEAGEPAHADLYQLRGRLKDKQAQDDIAPLEHYAFAREATAENPLLGIPIAVASPGYSAIKALGLTNARSKPSWAEVGAGLTGVGHGFVQALRKWRKPEGGSKPQSSGPQTSVGGESD